MTKNEVALSELPHNGRIGRFVKILEKERDKDTVLKVLENAIHYNSLNKEQKSALLWLEILNLDDISSFEELLACKRKPLKKQLNE
ncbi:hypothetical protein I5677_02380 [Mobilitalea sibirica]|uniref:Uncharacterized protein n=1 Tax=Mobilitalea sibirica TaxID=1462919 RepID=A0A8J7H7V0_9FIRM|nr:hypothetical protein [Mobilitalea sibirica]MBH1939740.1 hypothetical protein [Mobilitalea sibirica]